MAEHYIVEAAEQLDAADQSPVAQEFRAKAAHILARDAAEEDDS